METETESQEKEEQPLSEKMEFILVKLDEAVMKLRRFILVEVLPDIGATPEQIESVRSALNHDSTLFVPVIRDFLANYMPQVLAMEMDFFRALFPPEFKEAKISIEHQKKGVLFARVFQSLLKDVDEQ